MIVAIAMSVMLLADADFGPRVQTIHDYAAGLPGIVVPPTLQAEKDKRLEELKNAIEGGAKSQDDFNALYTKFDATLNWLWQNAADKPTTGKGSYEETPEGWRVRNDGMDLFVKRSDFSMNIKAPGSEWHFYPSDEHDALINGKPVRFVSAQSIKGEEFRTGYSEGYILTLTQFPDAPGFELRLTINLIGKEVVFELSAMEEGMTLGPIEWPKAVETGNTDHDFAVVPHMQGMLLPGNWPQDIHQRDLCNSRTLYMPWWGQILDGHGIQTILETSDDAGVAYDHSKGGPTRMQPLWYPSLGKVRYLRTVRYIFDEHATYVTMAKRYRRFAQETGRFVSLNEKLARTPNVKEVIGRPVIHIGSLYHFVPESKLFNKDHIEANHQFVTFDKLAEQLKDLKAKGVGDAYVHLDGWGYYGYDNGHPDVLPAGAVQGGWDGLKRFADTCHELGYLFVVHDQYRDFYRNAVSFDDRLTAYRFDGSRELGSTWCGGPQAILSSRFAPEYVRRNHDLFAEHGVHLDGAYLDVFSIVPLEESSEKAHPVTRSECAGYRQHCWDLLRARGYVVSSEEPTDYAVAHLDLVHHGPYATYEKIGGGEARGIAIPLWNLVYHDSILLPWDMGGNGGWGIPNGDAGYLHCFLNAGLPYVGPGADEAQIQRAKEACALNARCAAVEMTNHEFLDDAHRKQRTTFADGTTVTVDFDKHTYTFAPPLQ